MRIPFRAKHMNDSMIIEYLVTWRHYNVILENSDIHRLLYGIFHITCVVV